MSLGPAGTRVVVSALGETPLDALEHHLHVEPQPPPDPAALDAHDVVIAVRAAAVGWVDLVMMSGQYQHLPVLPYTPGLEFAGEVVAVGPAVRSVAVGDHVIADGFRTGPRSQGAYRQQGGFQSYAIAPDDALVPLPPALSFEQGACLLGNYETAYHCLVTRGRLQAGETVLILGATGSTGLAAVQLAAARGATVIAAGRSAERLAAVRAHGAQHVVVTTEADGSVARFRDAVRALTDGRGVDVVYDGVGGDTSLEALRCVAFGARFLIVGWASTPFVARGKGQRGAPNANQLPTNLIMMKGLDVLGCPTVIGTERDPSLRGPRLAAVMDGVARGVLRPEVSSVVPLAEIVEALRAKWEGRFVGGIVVRP